MKKIIEFWDNINDTFAHRKIDKWLVDKNNLFKFYRDNLKGYNFRLKTVIDYGTGGGYLGEMLFQSYGLGYYIGYDISKKSIDAADKNLEKYSNKTSFYLIDDFPKLRKADYFICQAVIQHFPDQDYLKGFCEMINKSEIKNLILQVRKSHSDKNEFQENPYTNQKSVSYGCRINADRLSEMLINYKLIKKNDLKNNADTVYLYYEKK